MNALNCSYMLGMDTACSSLLCFFHLLQSLLSEGDTAEGKDASQEQSTFSIGFTDLKGKSFLPFQKSKSRQQRLALP